MNWMLLNLSGEREI